MNRLVAGQSRAAEISSDVIVSCECECEWRHRDGNHRVGNSLIGTKGKELQGGSGGQAIEWKGDDTDGDTRMMDSIVAYCCRSPVR